MSWIKANKNFHVFDVYVIQIVLFYEVLVTYKGRHRYLLDFSIISCFMVEVFYWWDFVSSLRSCFYCPFDLRISPFRVWYSSSL